MIASLVVAGAIASGILTTAWQAILALRSEQQALSERANSEAALGFLRELLEADPKISKPGGSPNRSLTLLSRIQVAGQGIEERYQNQPLALASIHLILGSALRSLCDYQSVQPHLEASWRIFEKEVGPDSEMANLAHSRGLQEIPLRRHLYEQAEQAFGKESLETLLEQWRLGAMTTLVRAKIG